MKVVFTAAALADLDEILAYTATHYPSLAIRVESRIRDVIAHIEERPRNARIVNGQANLRVVPLEHESPLLNRFRIPKAVRV